MSDIIVSREAIRDRARAAFAAGKPRDSHNMNWHAAALADWLAEYDRLAAHANDIGLESRRAIRAAKALPPLHGDRSAGVRIDAHQVSV